MTQEHCEKDRNLAAISDCILYRWRMNTLIDVDTSGVLVALSKLYDEPRNLPIRWDHAVIIAEAMVSGVPISEKELEKVRQDDAKRYAK